ncbi:MAG: DMT family transporter [Desulfobacterales bacterium]|nr:DMT family transporter [Desulfobacterales bacterium]
MIRHRNLSLKTSCPHLHLLRAAAGLSAMYCFFIALKLLRLADAMLLCYTLPIFIPIIEWFWLKEPVSRQTKIAVIVGFIGIALVLKPGFGLFQAAGLVGLASGLLAALAIVGIRRMTVTEPVVRVVFYFTAFGTLVSAIPLAWAWQNPAGPYAVGALRDGGAGDHGPDVPDQGIQPGPGRAGGAVQLRERGLRRPVGMDDLGGDPGRADAGRCGLDVFSGNHRHLSQRAAYQTIRK